MTSGGGCPFIVMLFRGVKLGLEDLAMLISETVNVIGSSITLLFVNYFNSFSGGKTFRSTKIYNRIQLTKNNFILPGRGIFNKIENIKLSNLSKSSIMALRVRRSWLL